jgi:hypothetical protein
MSMVYEPLIGYVKRTSYRVYQGGICIGKKWHKSSYFYFHFGVGDTFFLHLVYYGNELDYH